MLTKTLHSAVVALAALLVASCCSQQPIGPAGTLTTRQEQRAADGTLREVRVWVDGELTEERHWDAQGHMTAIYLRDSDAD